MRNFGIGVAVFLFVVLVSFLSFTAYKHYAVPSASSAEQAASAGPAVQVRTVGYNGEAVVAHVVAPGGWTLHWERNGQLLDSVTGEMEVAEDIAIYLSAAEAKNVYPVLVWGDVEKKGSPIP
jgi:hypothetical protein